MPEPKLRVGIVGCGLGGLAAAIAVCRAGAEVTVLEQTAELGEIGAGIMVFPNVSRFMIRWGVDEIIGDNLVWPEEANIWGSDNDGELKLVSRSDPKRVAKVSGFPWWIARRDHLHTGFLTCARNHGATIHTNARVTSVCTTTNAPLVTLTTSDSRTFHFDLLIGADGLKSFIRSTLFPAVQPTPPSRVAAYRGVVSYSLLYSRIPQSRLLFRNAINMFTSAPGHSPSYIQTYPMAAGRELNVVACFYTPNHKQTTLSTTDVSNFHALGAAYPSIISQLLALIPTTKIWPVFQVPPHALTTWSNPTHNIVLLGDAAHAMTPHLGQGAATAIEDAAFLAHLLSESIHGTISTTEAIHLYEQTRIPKTRIKQQLSFLAGILEMGGPASDSPLLTTRQWTTQDDPLLIRHRDANSAPEVAAASLNATRQAPLPWSHRSWAAAFAPESAQGIFYYDAEADADGALAVHLCTKGTVQPGDAGLVDELEKMWWARVLDVDHGVELDRSVHVQAKAKVEEGEEEEKGR